MAIDHNPLAAAEMEPIAKWFRDTLHNADRARGRQEHDQAAGLVAGCVRVFRALREHGAEHGYNPDILFGDISDEIARHEELQKLSSKD